MRKTYLFILLVCLLAGLPRQTRAQSDSIVRYSTEHPLIYEDAWDLWPYVFLNENGEPDGFNIDLLKLIFKELDIPFVIKLMPTLDAQADLKNGKSDLMLRMDAEYSRGNSLYGKSIVQLFTHSVVMPKDKAVPLETGKSLTPYDVIVHDGSFSHHLIQKQGWAKEIIAYEDMKDAIQSVSSKNEGIIVWNTMSLNWLMRKFRTENLTIQPIDLPYGEYKFMSKNHHLLEQIDSAYTALRAADKIQPIQNKWFYPDRKESGLPSWIWKVALLMIGIAIAILAYYLIYKQRERKMTKAMRKSNDRLSLILKTSHVRLWTYNVMTNVITWIDEQGNPLRSAPLDEYALKARPEDIIRLQHAVDEVARQKVNGKNINIRFFDDNSDKERDYIISLSVLRRDKHGDPTTILGTRSDITSELLRQMKVKETMLRYQAVFQTAMVDMTNYDANGIITDMNQKGLSSLGMDIETIRKMHVSLKDVTGLDIFMDSNFDSIYMTQIYGGEDDDRILGKLTKGRRIYYEQQIIALHDANGKVAGFFGTGRNVTEVANSYKQQKQYIQELQQANDEMTEYIQNIDYVLSVGGIRLIEYHPDTHLLLVYSATDHVGLTLTQTRIINLVDASSKKRVERILNSMDNQSTTPILADVKTVLRAREGLALHLQIHLLPNYDEQGRLMNYIGMCRDISELKAIEEKLAKETLRAQEVEVVKNAFLHNMSFEIRTPLNTVVGFAELFQMEHSAEDEVVFINEIKENSAKLLRLINDILFLSRLDADMITMTKRTVDFANAIDSKCEAAWASDKQPDVQYAVKRNFNKLVLEIDESNLDIILDKIITNAVQHTTKGQVLVRYDYLGEELIVAVDDTGEGIPDATLAHIFERFVTGDSNTSRAGLGLSICHDLIQHLGGTINIKSTLGKGTSVWFAIPCQTLEIERL